MRARSIRSRFFRRFPPPRWGSGSATLLPASTSVIVLIGIILLIGIVKKSIRMIDFRARCRTPRGPLGEASIHRACVLRLPPDLMTTMAALLGAVPAPRYAERHGG